VDAKKDDDTAVSDSGYATVRVPVQKKDIIPGTTIENPADFFDEKDLPESALPANAVRTLDELKGQTFKKHAYADTPVVKAALQGDLPAAGGAKTGVASAQGQKIHTKGSQVGTGAPQYYRDEDKGKLLQDSGKPTTAPAAGSSPAVIPPAGAESPPIKAEDSDKEVKDKKQSNADDK